jgi:hypothetical protein
MLTGNRHYMTIKTNTQYRLTTIIKVNLRFDMIIIHMLFFT